MKTPTTRLAATLIIVGVALSYFISQWFLLIPLFVAINMMQYTFTNWCLADKIFKW
jgi:hypothetical protein